MESSKQILKPRNPGESLKVAETVLKRRNHDLQGMAQRAKQRVELRKMAARKRTYNAGIVTPEKMIKNKRVQLLDAKRLARLRNTRDLPRVRSADRYSSLFVVRNARTPPCRSSLSILKRLGLTSRYSATFTPNTAEAIAVLRSIQPFVFYGFLCPDTMHKMFFKSLRFKSSVPARTDDSKADDDLVTTSLDAPASVTPVTVCDNAMVEDHLGHLGILCIDDLMEEIKSCGKNFDTVMNLLCPFQLGDVRKAEGIDANILESGHLGFGINEKLSKLVQ